MAARIKYKPHPTRENVLESDSVFVSYKTNAEYLITLDLNDYTYEIKNLRSQKKFKGGENITNLNVLKRTARKKLVDLGVALRTESRNRTFGLCEKGYTQNQHLERREN